MNRSEFDDILSARFPIIIEENKSLIENMEKLRKSFVKDYPIKSIKSLALDEYVIGKGASNKSFCYRVEWELDQLGKIVGSPARKFGLWYGRVNKSDKTNEYRCVKKFGENYLAAFEAVKNEISNLLLAGEVDDFSELRSNKISPMFKGKLLYIYYPQKFLPIYAESHLHYFLNKMNLVSDSVSELDMQKTIMEYLGSFPDVLKHPVHYRSKLLYDQFGRPSKEAAEKKTRKPLPQEAIPEIIISLPLSGKAPVARGGGSPWKPDYEAQARNKRGVGERGEVLVFENEKKRLELLGKPELAKKVKHVSLADDSLGYDILSFDELGQKRFIEVKSTTSQYADKGFYISKNEADKSQTLDNYYVYLVFSVYKKKPQILHLKVADIRNDSRFKMTPVQYQVGIIA